MSLTLLPRSSVAKTEKNGFVPQPVLRKNLSRILKFRLRLLKISPGRRHGNTGKNWQKCAKVVFWRENEIPDPPPR
jgi:hypothetical protein